MDVLTLIAARWCLYADGPRGRKIRERWRMACWRARLGAVGADAHIYPNVVVHSPSKVRLGRRVNIAEFVHIWGGGGVEIGDNTIIAAHSAITSQTHDVEAEVVRDSIICA